MEVLKACGWTGKDLFKIQPGPGGWGIAWEWITKWGQAPVSARVNEKTRAIEFIVHAPGGDVTLEAFPGGKLK